MTEIVKMQFGSVVYGTQLPESDIDIKAVHIPNEYDILLGKIKNSIVKNTKEKKDSKSKNGDIDFESYAYHYFLNLLASGQTVVLDMLFTPEKHLIKTSPEWEYIYNNKNLFLSNKLYAFVGYCRSQANKYSIKGTRLKEAKKALEILTRYYNTTPQEKMAMCFPEFEDLITNSNHISIKNKENINGVIESYLSVCEKQIPKGATIKTGYNILFHLVNSYGLRSKETETNSYDRKALYHAVRIAYEAIELLKTGIITFPRPEVDLLMKIRLGEYSYDYLQELLDELLLSVELEMNSSVLPESVNKDFIDNLVYKTYKNQIINSANSI
jgi:hypothetical protein